MKMLLNILIILVLVIAVAVAGFFIAGPERVWSMVAGNADLGVRELSTVTRSSAPHDGLICTDGLCEGVTVDLILPAYEQTPEALLVALDASARQVTPDLERVDDQSDPLKARYVTRSPTLRFPDTTWVEAVDLGDGTSGLRIYSKAQLGYRDFGANLARITDWAESIN